MDGTGPEKFWMTVIFKVNVTGQMLFGWLVDFCSIRDDAQPVRGLIDTTPSVIAAIIHWFFNVLPRYFHLIWFAQGSTSLGHTELSMTMGWVGQFSVQGEYFHVTIYQNNSFKCFVQFISDVIQIQFVSSRHNEPGGDKGTTHWISLHPHGDAE